MPGSGVKDVDVELQRNALLVAATVAVGEDVGAVKHRVDPVRPLGELRRKPRCRHARGHGMRRRGLEHAKRRGERVCGAGRPRGLDRLTSRDPALAAHLGELLRVVLGLRLDPSATVAVQFAGRAQVEPKNAPVRIYGKCATRSCGRATPGQGGVPEAFVRLGTVRT